MNCSRCGHHQDAHGHVSNICPDHRGFFSAAVTDPLAVPAPPAPGSPDEPTEPLFVAIKSAVMAGKDHVATACSKTMAKRIAAALNKARRENLKDGSV
jgi:hypothetical protein